MKKAIRALSCFCLALCCALLVINTGQREPRKAIKQQYYELGLREGYDQGVYDGENRGYEKGYRTGWEVGERSGFDQGYVQGLMKGEDIGYCKGLEAGFQDGYDRGYDDGLDARRLLNTIIQWMLAVLGGLAVIASTMFLLHYKETGRFL